VEEIKSRNEEDMKIKQDEFSDRIDMIGNMQAELKDILRNKSLTRS
jgi:hypothetical protein